MIGRRRIGRWKGGYVCRCRRAHCQLRDHRFWRARQPLDYYGSAARWGVCPSCKQTLTVDRYRSSGRENARTNCNCGGYPFQHRRGSLFCDAGRAGRVGFSFFQRDDEFLRWCEAGQPMRWEVAA